MNSVDRTLTQHLADLLELNFLMSSAPDTDTVCRFAVEKGRSAIGVDRIGIWFLAPDDPEVFVGTFGIDEQGFLRDERTRRIRIVPEIYDREFFSRQIPFRFFPESQVYDDKHNVIGNADLVVAPIWDGERSIGALSADTALSGRSLTDEHCQLTAHLARIVGHVVALKRTTAALERLATTDDLTGIFNRRTGIEFLEYQMRLARRTGDRVSIVYLDLDGFKRINDKHGHAIGDRYLLEVVDLIRKVLREADMVCRMGGDEFMIILPGSAGASAKAAIQRLGDCAAESTILMRYRSGHWFSYGIAEYTGGGTSAEELIHTADLLMYEQKRTR